jgi:hypothetical protein
MEKEVRVRNLYSAQIVEFIRLPEPRVPLRHAGTLNQRYGIRADRPANRRPACGEFFRRKIIRKVWRLLRDER